VHTQHAAHGQWRMSSGPLRWKFHPIPVPARSLARTWRDSDQIIAAQLGVTRVQVAQVAGRVGTDRQSAQLHER